MGIMKKLRIMFGKSPVGPYWRQFKQRLALQK